MDLSYPMPLTLCVAFGATQQTQIPVIAHESHRFSPEFSTGPVRNRPVKAQSIAPVRSIPPNAQPPLPPRMKTSFLRPSSLIGCAVFLALIAAMPSLTAKDRGTRQPLLIAKFADATAASTADALAGTTDAWQNIKDYPYEKRGDFVAVFTRMVAKFDDDLRALHVQRATMTNDTKNWDFAMKELNNARSDVQSKFTDLSKANNTETWVEARDRVGLAWERARTAYGKVKASTTS